MLSVVDARSRGAAEPTCDRDMTSRSASTDIRGTESLSTRVKPVLWNDHINFGQCHSQPVPFTSPRLLVAFHSTFRPAPYISHAPRILS